MPAVAHVASSTAGQYAERMRVGAVLATCVAFAVCSLASSAHAAAPDVVDDPMLPPVEHHQAPMPSYPGQIVLADVVALGAVAGSAGLALTTGNPVPSLLVGGAAIFAAPTVHWFHGRGLIGLASLGLHTFSLVANGFLGAAFGSLVQRAPYGRGCFNCGGGGGTVSDENAMIYAGIVGSGVGIVAAMAIDAAFLARTYPKKASDPDAVPVVSLLPGGAVAGVAGRF